MTCDDKSIHSFKVQNFNIYITILSEFKVLIYIIVNIEYVNNGDDLMILCGDGAWLTLI